MIKLACLAILPVLAATIYVHREPQPPKAGLRLRASASVEERDRQFLLTLMSRQENYSVGSGDRADQEFLTNLEVEERLAVESGSENLPVMRAIPIEGAEIETVPEPVTVTVTVARVAAGPVGADASITGDVAEVRRAMPVVTKVTLGSRADLRERLQESFVTMIEPEMRVGMLADRW